MSAGKITITLGRIGAGAAAVVMVAVLCAGNWASGALTIGQYNDLMAEAASWYQLDTASSGLAQPAQIVDSNSGIDGTAYAYQSGSQDFAWTSVPSPMGSGASTDGMGLQLNENTGLVLGTPGADNALYQTSGAMTFFARVNFDDFANTHGQGVDLFGTFRWNGGLAEGVRVAVSTSANPTVDRVVQLMWGTGTTYATNDPNQFTTVKPVAGEWNDIFIVLDPNDGATGTLRVYVAPTASDAMPNTLYTTVQNDGNINGRVLAPVSADWNTARLGLGNHSFNGMLESVAVWDRALTYDELQGIHTIFIPEPSTLALLALALPLLRRRK